MEIPSVTPLSEAGASSNSDCCVLPIRSGMRTRVVGREPAFCAVEGQGKISEADHGLLSANPGARLERLIGPSGVSVQTKLQSEGDASILQPRLRGTLSLN